MKEITGQIKNWDEASQRGKIEGDDGMSYSFTSEEWMEDEQPEFHGEVLVISQNGREASQVKHLRIMRVSDVRIPGKFKRFGSLEIQELGADVELVVMLGPNGSGKSSVFDAFLEWARAQGRRSRIRPPNDYFDFETGNFGRPEVTLHGRDDSEDSEYLGTLVHVRTAHRNTPDVLSNSIEKQEDFRRRRPFDRMVQTDSALGEHYQRLVARFLPVLSNLDNDDAAGDLESVRAVLKPVQDSLTRVLPHLRFTGLGDATSAGSFYFTREGIRNFRYESLSGGEKAVFDLLLDVHVAAIELGSPLICLDEPEVHLNPAVQASVLTELLRLLPRGSQLWIATHSVGMIRRAFDISASTPERVVFLDFGKVKGPAPDVRLKPSLPSGQLLRDAMSVALDDLAGLLAPEILVICEGSQASDRKFAWDEHIYRQIFHDWHPRVEFKSSGGKSELERAAAIASVIAPGTHILKLRDRDDLSPEGRARLLEDEPNLRVLKQRSLESYLLDVEVLQALVDDRGTHVKNAVDKLKEARDGAILPNGSAKGAIGAVFNVARTILVNTDGLGENASQFSADVLAKLITPEMTVRQELESVLNLP